MSALLCRICGEHKPIRGTSLCTACVNSRIALQDAAAGKNRVADAYATQEFAVRHALMPYAGDRLTCLTFDLVVAALMLEMLEGEWEWAFELRLEEDDGED